MEDTISLKNIFTTLKKRWRLIVLITLVSTLISLTYFLFYINTYISGIYTNPCESKKFREST